MSSIECAIDDLKTGKMPLRIRKYHKNDTSRLKRLYHFVVYSQMDINNRIKSPGKIMAFFTKSRNTVPFDYMISLYMDLIYRTHYRFYSV